jgi:hypothetical protein
MGELKLSEFVTEMYEVLREARETCAVDSRGRNVEMYFGDMMRRLEDAVEVVNDRVAGRGGRLSSEVAAQSASAERVRSVVMEAVLRGIDAGLVSRSRCANVTDLEVLGHIADRVASQLAVPVLSAEERYDLSYLVGWCNASAGDVTVERQRFDRGVALLDRLLGAKP